MTNNAPEYRRKISRYSLSESDYFVSLMNAAIKADMLTADQELDIKRECGELLAFKAGQFTDGQSSSLPTEAAKEILSSVYFVIGLGLKAYHEPDAAVDAILSEGVNAIYTQGVARQRELLLKAKKVYQALNKSFNGYGCIYYEGTVRKSIPTFFKKYIPDNHKLLSHETFMTPDYATYLNTKNTVGVEFMKNYVERLYCENAFTTAFSEDAVSSLLRSYDNHYEHVLFNVYELVYTRALGRILCGEEPLSLESVDEYIPKLNDVFKDKSLGELIDMLKNALETLEKYIELSPTAQKYTELCIPQTASAILTAMRIGVLKRIFS